MESISPNANNKAINVRNDSLGKRRIGQRNPGLSRPGDFLCVVHRRLLTGNAAITVKIEGIAKLGIIRTLDAS
jgi:hypothetical protein